MPSLIARTKVRQERRVGTDGTPSFPCIFLQLNRQTNRRSRANCFEANGRPADKRVLEAREIKVEPARDIHCVALIYEVGNGRGRRQRRRPIPLSTARRPGKTSMNGRARGVRWLNPWPNPRIDIEPDPLQRHALDFIVLFQVPRTSYVLGAKSIDSITLRRYSRLVVTEYSPVFFLHLNLREEAIPDCN